ncbi:MAG: endo-1,4-beta-xylanase [Anaerolineales bacterium]|nr:endo-1,4-beta-xylanase [Anaerolineales bacterium]
MTKHRPRIQASLSILILVALLLSGCIGVETTMTAPATATTAPPAEEPTPETAAAVAFTAEQAAEGYHFDDGSLQGWEPRGAARVSLATDVGRKDDSSLLVTDRAEDWNGAMVDVKHILKPNTMYAISAYVRLGKGMPSSKVILSMERTPVGGDPLFERLAPSADDGVNNGQWTLLNAEYSYRGEAESLYLYVESPDDELVDFYIDDVRITELETLVKPPREPEADLPSLAETFAGQFLIGTALEPFQLDSEYHAQLLEKHFNSITAENVMKPVSIQPREGEFTFKAADRLVEYAREHGMAVHGHTLVWHNQAAEWMFRDSAGNPLEPTEENKALVLERLETHIRAVVERYKDDVNVWDVVNEAIDQQQDDCMRRTPWFELTGMDYITTAFEVAREVDPDAVLIINDYYLTNPDKRACMVALVSDLQAQGVPVDGIGMQMHVNVVVPSAAEVEESIEAYAQFGEVHITEMDMSLYNNDNDDYETVPEDVLVAQGYRYKELFEVFTRMADKIGSVTMWGMADDYTWLKYSPVVRLNLPLLFDEQLQAKPAFWGVVDPEQLPVFTQRVSIAESTPQIDGEIETLWITQPWQPVTIGVDFQTRWDADNLYLLVRTAGIPAADDMIAVYLDEGNDKIGPADQVYVFQGITCADCGALTYATSSDGEYSYLEAAIPLATAVETYDQVGFDIRYTTAALGGPVSWNDKTHNQDADSAGYGILRMAPAARITFALPGTPVIDAEEDEIWADANVETTTVWVLGGSGSIAEVRTLWDSDNLYVYAEVTDALLSNASANEYEQDSLEVYVDQNNGKTTSYEPDDGQYRISYENVHSFGGFGSEERITSATRITDTGYVVELAIHLDAITPEPGMIIGYDFQVNNDEDGDGARDSVVTWNDPTHQTYLNLTRTGLLMFTE